MDTSFPVQVKLMRCCHFLEENVDNNLPEGYSYIMLCSLCFSLSAQDAFAQSETGDGAA